MELKSLFLEDDAVSPVIGVILMVAITVILAAVIGAFVLGIGGSQEKVPQASFSWDNATGDGTNCGSYASGSFDVTVNHEGGDKISIDNLELGGVQCSGADLSAGKSLNIDSVEPDNTISLVWKSPSSDSTSVLSSFDV